MSSKNIILFVLSLLVVLLVAGCGGECEGTIMADGTCQHVVGGQYVPVPEKGAVQQANDGIGKVISPSTAPNKQLTMIIGTIRPAKELNDFADSCGRSGGTVANVNAAQLGCYK